MKKILFIDLTEDCFYSDEIAKNETSIMCFSWNRAVLIHKRRCWWHEWFHKSRRFYDSMNDSNMWCWSCECRDKFCHRLWISKRMNDDYWHILLAWLALKSTFDENIFVKFRFSRLLCRRASSDDVHRKKFFVERAQMISSLIEKDILLWSRTKRFQWTRLCECWLRTSLWLNDWFNYFNCNWHKCASTV